MATIYYGPVINPQSLTDYLALPRCLILISSDGDIDRVYEDVQSSQLQDILAQSGYADLGASFIQLKEGQFLMPGLIDTHTHACQVPNLGVGGGFQLLQWLDNYTFPTEARFKDVEYAKRAYPDVVQRIVNSGTTTCCYYGSLHLEATKILADLVHDRGQRAFVGKCNMNQNCPPNYIEPSVQESVDTTLALFRHIEELPKTRPNGQPLVHPILTPRFAISCTEELLERLGKIALDNPQLAIQTHISENKDEVELTKTLFNADSYAQVYERFHLLRHNTILAHGVHLTEDEMVLIAKHGAGVSHCPTSNFYLSSGMARVGMLLDHGVNVGLGTDAAGGYSPSILSTIQHASIASKMLAVQAAADKKCNCSRNRHGSDVDSEELESQSHEHHGHNHGCGCNCDKKKPGRFTNEKLSIAALLYLATLGGAHVCCLQDRIGSFEKGKAFDALLVSVSDETGNPGIWGYNPERDSTDVTAQNADKSLMEWLERFLFCGDDRNIRRVIVQGRMIGGQEYQY